jgi:hypothetical protein
MPNTSAHVAALEALKVPERHVQWPMNAAERAIDVAMGALESARPAAGDRDAEHQAFQRWWKDEHGDRTPTDNAWLAFRAGLRYAGCASAPLPAAPPPEDQRCTLGLSKGDVNSVADPLFDHARIGEKLEPMGRDGFRETVGAALAAFLQTRISRQAPTVPWPWKSPAEVILEAVVHIDGQERLKDALRQLAAASILSTGEKSDASRNSRARSA